MAMGIVSKIELDLEIDKNKSLPSAMVKEREIGRGHIKQVPDEIKKMVGELGLISGSTGRNLAETFGVSESSISAYKVGAASTASYNSPKPELISHITGIKKKISLRAQRVLSGALRELTPERVAMEKPRDIAAIASRMAGIVQLMEPEEKVLTQIDNSVKFVMYAPVMKQESSYDAIDVAALDGEVGG